MTGLEAAAVTATIGFISNLVTNKMSTDAAAAEVEKRRKAASQQADFSQAEAQRKKFTPKQVTPAPAASSVRQLGGGSRLPVDTGNIRLSTPPRVTAAERIKRRLQTRRA